MVFHNIFDFSRSSSDATATAESGISGYLATQPVEAISVPPHDPSQPYVDAGLRDPKIVRETSPSAGSVFGWLGTLTGAIKQSADQQEAANNDPTTTIDPAESIVKTGAAYNPGATADIQQPTAQPPLKPTVGQPPKPTVGTLTPPTVGTPTPPTVQPPTVPTTTA